MNPRRRRSGLVRNEVLHQFTFEKKYASKRMMAKKYQADSCPVSFHVRAKCSLTSILNTQNKEQHLPVVARTRVNQRLVYGIYCRVSTDLHFNWALETIVRGICQGAPFHDLSQLFPRNSRDKETGNLRAILWDNEELKDSRQSQYVPYCSNFLKPQTTPWKLPKLRLRWWK